MSCSTKSSHGENGKNILNCTYMYKFRKYMEYVLHWIVRWVILHRISFGWSGGVSRSKELIDPNLTLIISKLFMYLLINLCCFVPSKIGILTQIALLHLLCVFRELENTSDITPRWSSWVRRISTANTASTVWMSSCLWCGVAQGRPRLPIAFQSILESTLLTVNPAESDSDMFQIATESCIKTPVSLYSASFPGNFLRT